MDSVFQLSHEARGQFLRYTARAIGCSYISLWSYQPHPSPCLVSIDGWLKDYGDGERAPIRRLFDEYRKSVCIVGNSCVPGCAYKVRSSPYVELHGSDLLRCAAVPVQRQFYQEAGIKTAVFMGCNSGEIEVGMPITGTKFDTKMSIMSYFPEDVSAQSYARLVGEQSTLPTSSSSSIPSFSTSSPECSSFLLNMASTSGTPPPDPFFLEASVEHAVHPIPSQYNKVTFGQYRQTYSSPREAQISWQRTNAEDTMMRAMIAVLSSSNPSSSSYSSSSHPSPLPVINSSQRRQGCSYRESAFRPYSRGNRVGKRYGCAGSQNMLRRMHAMLKSIDLVKPREVPQEQARATSNQLHHMISERKRREKLNESFQALRSLLPPGTKKDKASVLATAKGYLNHLKAQITYLERKNQELELQFFPSKEEEEVQLEVPSNDAVKIQVIEGSKSMLEMRHIKLKVTMGGECDIVDMVLNILQSIKDMENIDITSMEANGHTRSAKRATLTLQIKGSDWDEDTFKEAIERAIIHGASQPTVTSFP